MSSESKPETKETKACPMAYSDYFKSSYVKSLFNKEGKLDKLEKKLSTRKFPWKAFGGLSLVTIVTLLSTYLFLALLFNYFSVLWTLIKLPFKLVGLVLSIAFWPAKLLTYGFSFIFRLGSSTKLPLNVTEVAAPSCLNSMELQGWEVLNLLPGSDGNPANVKYTLNSPTPHAVSVVDIDYRDTRIDVLSNGKYFGSTSDFKLNKTDFCGEDLNKCLAQGFSTGTFVIPGGKQQVELAWSGKDVFPGTDKIVWGGERKRRVMWKKELCL